MKDILFTDMSLCKPEGIIKPDYQPDSWICYDYETADLKGKAAFAGPFDDPPDLELPLTVEGWHHIYVGVHYGIVGHIFQERGEHAGSRIAVQFLRTRLSSDKCWDIIQPEYPRQRQHGYYTPPEESPEPPEVRYDQIVEVYWKTCDLSGESLHFSPWRDRLEESTCAGVAYVRLEPLSDAMLDEHRSELGRPDTKRLLVVNDGYFQGYHPTNESEVRQWLEPMRDSDIAFVMWGASILDQCAYPTKAGCFVRGESAHLYDSLIKGVKPPQNFDHLETAAGVAHEMEIKLYGSMRPSGGRIPPGHLPDSPHTFFHNHPEYWCVDENGRKVGHMSLAFPEVRSKQILVLREFVEDHSCDGVHYHFNRCFPFVLFEEPVLIEFREKYDEDPRELDRGDERWLEHRSGYVTTFVREVRRMLDEVSAAKGRQLGLALTVMNSLENNLFNGFDLKTWIEEDLVDHLMMHPGFFSEIVPDTFKRRAGGSFTSTGKVLPETVIPVQKLSEGKRCRVYADLYPRYQTADSYRQQAIGFYDAGVYGLAVWDYYWRIWRKSEWNMIRRLGHRDELNGWREKVSSYTSARQLSSLAGMSMDPRYSIASNG